MCIMEKVAHNSLMKFVLQTSNEALFLFRTKAELKEGRSQVIM